MHVLRLSVVVNDEPHHRRHPTHILRRVQRRSSNNNVPFHSTKDDNQILYERQQRSTPTQTYAIAGYYYFVFGFYYSLFQTILQAN